MSKKRPPISGFCNPSNPPDSHARCRMPDCTCFHHWEPEPAENGDPVSTTPEPGLHPDIPEQEYHADRGSLSVSGAKVLLKAPAKFQWQQAHPVFKDVFDFGTAAHRLVLGVGPALVIHDFDPAKVKSPKATTAWKEQQAEVRGRGDVLLLPDEHAAVRAMTDKLAENPTAMRLLSDGTPEVSAYADDPITGVRMRCRYDWLGDGYGADYKSCADASPDGFARSVANFGYDQQDDWYRHVATLLGRPLEAFCFIAQEKEPPYLVEVYELDEQFRARGRQRNERARQIFAECTASGDWSRGYTGEPFSTLYAPYWATKELTA